MNDIVGLHGPPAQRGLRSLAPMMTLTGGIVVIVGATLPWTVINTRGEASAFEDFILSFSRLRGIEQGTGHVAVLALGAVIVSATIMMLARTAEPLHLPVAAAGLAALGIIIFHRMTLEDPGSDIATIGSALGSGAWAIFVGAPLVALSALSWGRPVERERRSLVKDPLPGDEP